MLWEELLVAAFEDVHLWVIQAGVVVSCTVPFPDEAAPGAAWVEVQGRPQVRKRPCFKSLPSAQAPQHKNVTY